MQLLVLRPPCRPGRAERARAAIAGRGPPARPREVEGRASKLCISSACMCQGVAPSAAAARAQPLNAT